MFNNKNIKIFLNYWLGPVLFVWLSWSIYSQLMHHPDLSASKENFIGILNSRNAWKCWVVIFLMFVNWGIEAWKWVLLLKPIYELSIKNSLKAIMTGVAFAINTPNRIGEYGGRILYLPEDKRLQAVSLTLIGSFSQLLITLLLGTIGLWLFYSGLPGINLNPEFRSYMLWLGLLCFVLSTITVLIMFLYFRVSWFVRWIEKLPGIEKWGKNLLVIDHLPVRILLRVLGWSFVRYVVFVIQYILLLQCFEVTQNIWTAWWLISILFLVLAIIPTIALAELGIRGKLALELFGWVSTNQLGIVTAAISLWLINLVMPAILGSLLIVRVKFFSSPYKKEN